MGRQYVHHSADRETAREVGRRKAADPAVLVVDAEGAREAGVTFSDGNEKVWLSDPVSPEHLERD